MGASSSRGPRSAAFARVKPKPEKNEFMSRSEVVLAKDRQKNSPEANMSMPKVRQVKSYSNHSEKPNASRSYERKHFDFSNRQKTDEPIKKFQNTVIMSRFQDGNDRNMTRIVD